MSENVQEWMSLYLRLRCYGEGQIHRAVMGGVLVLRRWILVYFSIRYLRRRLLVLSIPLIIVEKHAITWI
mgnify:CR=1 FL=1